jgi:hypothetical protein
MCAIALAGQGVSLEPGKKASLQSKSDVMGKARPLRCEDTMLSPVLTAATLANAESASTPELLSLTSASYGTDQGDTPRPLYIFHRDAKPKRSSIFIKSDNPKPRVRYGGRV